MTDPDDRRTQQMLFFSSRSRQSEVSRVVAAFAAIAWMAIPISVGRVATAAGSDRAARARVDGDLKGSYRFERNGWIYVHLEGAPSRVGYQHGYLLAPEIGDL